MMTHEAVALGAQPPGHTALERDQTPNSKLARAPVVALYHMCNAAEESGDTPQHTHAARESGEGEG